MLRNVDVLGTLHVAYGLQYLLCGRCLGLIDSGPKDARKTLASF